MHRIVNTFVRSFIRIFLPGIAQSLREEGQFDFQHTKQADAGATVPEHIVVENNGADTTIICFAGMAVLYAAMPKFEFRNLLTSSGISCNFIWVRDCRRSSYNLTPAGEPGGYAFYTQSIQEALATVASSRVIAIGASGGGSAAFAFSSRLPMDLILAFNPAFPLHAYGSPMNCCKALLDMKKLMRTPGDYFEVLLITLSARYLWKQDCRRLGRENLPDTQACYLEKKPPTPAVVFYSHRCRPDRELALRLQHIPEVTLKPIPSGRHNCMAELKQRGELGPLIVQHLQHDMPAAVAAAQGTHIQ